MTISQSRLFQGEDAGHDRSSKSLARNEASGMATASEQELEYRGDASSRGFGGSVHEKQMNTVEHMPGSALFLDGDGVINMDRGYINRPDQFEFVPGHFSIGSVLDE
jgi:hypothetical protein